MAFSTERKNSDGRPEFARATLRWLAGLAVMATAGLLGASLAPGDAHAKLNYTFEGDVEVKLPNGAEKPIPGAQIRVKRQGGSGAGRHKVRTHDDGRFKGTWKFTRDRDGGLPGRKDIRFAVQMRLRNSELKLRKGGWFKKNWITIATPRGKDGEDFDLNDIVLDSGKKQKLAALYWAHMQSLEPLQKHNVALTNKLTVIYPNKFVFKPNANFYLFKVRLTEEKWKVHKPVHTETILHEIMHQWDVNHMKGERNLVCVADAHHKSPDKWASARCSGFMEGFAEATAQQLNAKIFDADYYPDPGNNPPVPETMANLREGTNVSYEIENLNEAQTTDDGWENFLTFIMTEDKFERFGTVPDGSCKPKTVGVWQLLDVLDAEEPRKANFFRGKSTFSWFTRILQKHVDGFDAWDAKYYEMLGDPSNKLVDIQETMCGKVAVGEVKADENWESASMTGAIFDNPVVVTGPPTYNGEHPGVARVQNVDHSEFSVRLQEWDYREREKNDTNHAKETIPYMMVESGTHELSGGVVLEAGTFELDGTRSWDKQRFDANFPDRPKLFLTAQTANGGQAVVVRAKQVDADGFEAALFEEEALNDGHATETIGYVAVYTPSSSESISPSANSKTYSLETSTQKVDGSWTSVNGVSLILDEEKSKDKEVNHVDEQVDVLTLDNTLFAQHVTTKGNDTISLRQSDSPPKAKLKAVPKEQLDKLEKKKLPQKQLDMPKNVDVQGSSD